MTNKEAIRKLQKQKAEYLEEWVDFSGIAEAYDMAIEALSAETIQLRQADTLIIATALQYLIEDEERHELDRASAKKLRKQILKLGASMCADAVPQTTLDTNRQYGKWVLSHIGTIAEGFYCSRCGKHGYQTDFCPNCGAEMKKGGENK